MPGAGMTGMTGMAAVIAVVAGWACQAWSVGWSGGPGEVWSVGWSGKSGRGLAGRLEWQTRRGVVGRLEWRGSGWSAGVAGPAWRGRLAVVVEACVRRAWPLGRGRRVGLPGQAGKRDQGASA
ncbi:hypothetical protein ACQPYE_04425 [Actinosynnema sp. CA-299493]